MNSSVRDAVEFLGGPRDKRVLQEWYESLDPSLVKASVRTVKCRELRPLAPERFRLIVLCNHPFDELSRELEKAQGIGDQLRSDRTLSTLVSSFTQWIEAQGVPSETRLDERHASIDWWPVDMRQYVADDISAQAQAHVEMSNHILECLDLIRLATIPGPEFLGLWMDSNEPFFAAGRLFYGTLRWTTEVPGIGGNGILTGNFRDQVGEFAREYVGLVRLAFLAGAESPLLERTNFILRRFKIQFSAELPGWLALAHELLEGSEDVPVFSALATTTDYESIDRVCDSLRLSLAKATEGLEDELPAVINALLPTLNVPPERRFFEND